MAGPEVQDIFLTFTDTGDTDESALTKLTEYFAPKKNIPFERHLFRQTIQEPGESIESFVTRFRTLAKSCGFENMDEAIRDQVVEKCSSGKLRRRLLREADLTLTNCIETAKQFQASERHATQMEMPTHSSTPQDTASAVNAYSSQATRSRHNPGQRQSILVALTCFCCVLSGHKAKDLSCLGKGKNCNKCGKSGYFGRVCKSSPKPSNPQSRSSVNLITPRFDNDSSDDEYLFTFGNSSRRVPVIINGQEIPMVVDSGATVNVLDSNSFALLLKRGPIQLLPSRVRVYPYGTKTPLPVKGSFTVIVTSESSKKSTHAEFVVAQSMQSGSLLGEKTAIELNLLRVGPPVANAEVNYISPPSSVDRLLSRHPQVFEGVGKLTDYQLLVHADPNIEPVAQPLRRTPFYVRKDIEKKLKELQDLDIIEDVVGPTPWVSPLVAVPKSNGDIRVCVDMRRVNETILRERHPIPTLEETLQDLNGATVFSKLDLRWGYHQVELHPEYRILTTFSTHVRLKRYTRFDYPRTVLSL